MLKTTSKKTLSVVFFTSTVDWSDLSDLLIYYTLLDFSFVAYWLFFTHYMSYCSVCYILLDLSIMLHIASFVFFDTHFM